MDLKTSQYVVLILVIYSVEEKRSMSVGTGQVQVKFAKSIIYVFIYFVIEPLISNLYFPQKSLY